MPTVGLDTRGPRVHREVTALRSLDLTVISYTHTRQIECSDSSEADRLSVSKATGFEIDLAFFVNFLVYKFSLRIFVSKSKDLEKMGLVLKKKDNAEKFSERKTDASISNDNLKRMISNIDLKPLTKEEIVKSRMNAYQPVY